MSDYDGGIDDWIERGGALESSAKRGGKGAAEPTSTRASSSRDHRIPAGGRSWGEALIDVLVLNRTMGELLAVWAVMVIAFGVLYWLGAMFGAEWLYLHGTVVMGDIGDLSVSIYFSFVTALSIGYGDVSPLGLARILAIIEGAAGLLLFGCVVSKLVSRRQEELTEETHRISFEQRLGRVRTNLHLVLSELLNLTTMCDDESVPSSRTKMRARSTVVVFQGELDTVHDLLYRPEHAPDETTLTSILANLAACLEALEEFLRCAPANEGYLELLESDLQKIQGKAVEICAECVPQSHAPAMREWMDRVQELAERII